MKNNRIEYIDDNTARVTKAFEKNARFFGTHEFNMWREYLKEFPNAKMTTKTIKKNPNKKTYRNMTYKNMELFIEAQENSTLLKKEVERQRKMSRVQTNPYKAVLAWFCKEFEGYDNYKEFFKDKEENEETVETTEEAKEEIEETTESNIVKMAK